MGVWALALAGPALTFMVAWIIILIGGSPAWDWLDLLRGPSRSKNPVKALSWISLALVVILGIVMFPLASWGLKQVETQTGLAGLTWKTETNELGWSTCAISASWRMTIAYALGEAI